MTQLLYFYYGGHPDHKGRLLAEILRQDDDWLETTHDYIQWLFPLQKPSLANTHAPLLSRTDVEAFSKDEILRNHLRASLYRMLAFFGLAISENSIQRANNWELRRTIWFDEHTHNSLRISRMLESLRLLSLHADAEMLWNTLEELVRNEARCGITPKSRSIWREIMS